MNLGHAYKTLRKLGMRPAVAKHFIAGLRKQGFVLVKEDEIPDMVGINRKIEIIIKLMKRRGK